MCYKVKYYRHWYSQELPKLIKSAPPLLTETVTKTKVVSSAERKKNVRSGQLYLDLLDRARRTGLKRWRRLIPNAVTLTIDTSGDRIRGLLAQTPTKTDHRLAYTSTMEQAEQSPPSTLLIREASLPAAVRLSLDDKTWCNRLWRTARNHGMDFCSVKFKATTGLGVAVVRRMCRKPTKGLPCWENVPDPCKLSSAAAWTTLRFERRVSGEGLFGQVFPKSERFSLRGFGSIFLLVDSIKRPPPICTAW